MRSLFKTLCNNDFGLPGHSIIKHMHYDSSGSDETICKIVSQVAKTTTIGIMDKSGFLMVDYVQCRNNLAFALPHIKRKSVALYRSLRMI